jgi:hypothetical protein
VETSRVGAVESSRVCRWRVPASGWRVPAFAVESSRVCGGEFPRLRWRVPACIRSDAIARWRSTRRIAAVQIPRSGFARPTHANPSHPPDRQVQTEFPLFRERRSRADGVEFPRKAHPAARRASASDALALSEAPPAIRKKDANSPSINTILQLSAIRSSAGIRRSASSARLSAAVPHGAFAPWPRTRRRRIGIAECP